MNKIGTFSGVPYEAVPSDESLPGRLYHRVRRARAFLLIVVLPTLLVAAYYYLIAADQYQSEAHFIVNAGDQHAAIPSGFGQLLGIGGASQSQSQAMSVPDYLLSHDAVNALDARLNLRAIFRRPEVDALSRLQGSNGTPEQLLRYYNHHVDVYYNRDTGITSLKVRTFRPADAYVLVNTLLEMSEKRVNAMNDRSYADAVSTAKKQLATAEDAVSAIQSRMTALRQTHEDVDPEASGNAQIRLVSTLRGQLAAARAQLVAMRSLISPDSPQYVALAQQTASLEQELALQSSTAGTSHNGNGMAQTLGSYEDLKVRQDFAAKQYEAAAASLEKARQQAQEQQLYLIRVVNPNMPSASLYPERGKIVATVFIALFVAYGIGWLILAGIREHAA